MELPSLIWLKPGQILQTARDDVRLLNLLNVGAELVGEPFSPVPIDSWVRLTDSQEALALALDDETLTFYRSLLRTAG
jgi:hypothetical protein